MLRSDLPGLVDELPGRVRENRRELAALKPIQEIRGGFTHGILRNQKTLA